MSLRHPIHRSHNFRQRVLPIFVACAATLISAPGHAIDIPAIPLQSAGTYPAPNVVFILDDSQSMEGTAVYSDFGRTVVTASGLNGCTTETMDAGMDCDAVDQLYTVNPLSYTPATTYEPWYSATGNGVEIAQYPSATYDCANNDSAQVSVKADLSALTSCTSLPATNTFYVPKVAGSTSKNSADYYRYQVRKDSGTVRIIRSEYLARSGSSPAYNNGPDRAYGCSTTTNTTAWRNCTALTDATNPTGRTVAQEIVNYANWYTYFRTRIKAAKAGGSAAFSELGDNFRVGLTGLYGATGSYKQSLPSGVTLSTTAPAAGDFRGLPFPIQSTTDDGLFRGANRSNWFKTFLSLDAKYATPLRMALDTVGKYFKTDTPYKSASDGTPTMLACRQNFAILTTDGYWNNFSGNDPDSNYSGTKISGDEEAGDTIKGPKKPDYKYTPAPPYFYNPSGSADDGADDTTLADVAMHYWKTDLRPEAAMPNSVSSSTADPAFWQHMVTFGIGLGVHGKMTDAQIDAALSGDVGAYWSKPIHATDTADHPENIDDLWHATVNSHGTYVSASSSDDFAKALKNALSTVSERLGSASNVAANSTSLQTDTRVYQASYVPGKWTGELASYAASTAGVATDPSWTASGHITATGRKIYTWTGSAGATFPTSAQSTALDSAATSMFGAKAASGDLASYLKGDQSKEQNKVGGYMRTRSALLGDIVNSSPIYAKDSNTIFVGANDGMLHAFNADTGSEYFAYVPGGVGMANLAKLSDPAYGAVASDTENQHRYFVDGPIVVSTLTQTPSHNYLVGAMGRGGKGVFGLDVTTPGSFAAGNALWEQTTGTDMGYVLGEPLIVTLNDDDHTTAVIIGNGINSDSGTAALYVFNLATGALIQEIDTGVTGDNGLSAPRGWDDNGDGTVDYVYAGDMKGNLWKFDFTGETASVALGGSPLFTAATGQAITAGLALARDPATGKRWVYVGTGKFLESGDATDDAVQSLYGIIDDSVTATVHRSDLQERDIVVTSDDGTQRGFETHGSLTDGKQGWFIDLGVPTAGERIVSRPQIKGSVLVVASIIPPPPTDNSCEAVGSGYINALDAFTGTSTSSPYFDANGDGKVDENDQIDSDGGEVPVGSIDLGVGMPTLPTVIDKLLVAGGSNGSIGSVTINPQGGAAQRVSWREILED